MAEKRKLLAEVDKCFKKIDEGVELFEEIMMKVQEANSDNQREKYQDDLKKEIKKLQRLRDQVKVWQTSTDIKDKDKLNQYRKLIEQRMEQFKDIERENKTKPHSKQGLCAEEKLDPKEKEKSDTIDWLQGQLRVLNDESDRTEMQLESLNTAEVSKRGRKGGDSKKGDKDKKQETLNHRLERLKFHIGKLEVVMRMVNNESLDARTVLEVLKDTMEMYTDCFDPNYEGEEEDFDSLDPEDTYEELDLGMLCAQLGTIQMNSVDEEKIENGHDVILSPYEPTTENSRHGSTDATPQPNAPASPAPRRTVAAVAATAPQPSPKQLAKENSTETTTPAPFIPVPTTPVPSIPVATATPPPPPGIPYNSVAAGRVTTAAPTPPQTAAVNTGKATFPIPSVARQPNSQAATVAAAATTSTVPVVVEEKKPAVVETEKVNSMSPAPVAPPPIVDSYASIAKPQQTEKTATDVAVKGRVMSPVSATVAVQEPQQPKETTKKPWDNDSSKSSPIVMNGPTIPEAKSNDIKNDVPPGVPISLSTQVSQSGLSNMDPVAEEALRVLRMNQQNSTEPKRANIPAWLGASPLGRAPHQAEHDLHLAALENAFSKCTLPFESERPRIYLPKIPCPVAPHYPQVPAPNGDTLEYYLRLSPETLFFIFYYMEGTKAQLLAAKALKKLSWRFHTKYLTWFQRHEEPKQITDDFEQGTYVYFDFEKWSQRKKEAFTFEYRFLEDKEFD